MIRDDIDRTTLMTRLDAIKSEAMRFLEDSQTADDAVELDQTRQGRLSRMDALQSQAMSQAARHRARQTLQRVTATRQRLDDAEFGYCIDCDEPIGAARLTHDPTALRCIECAAAHE